MGRARTKIVDHTYSNITYFYSTTNAKNMFEFSRQNSNLLLRFITLMLL